MLCDIELVICLFLPPPPLHFIWTAILLNWHLELNQKRRKSTKERKKYCSVENFHLLLKF